jgi:peptide/nickel transport system permease protein
MLQYLLRRVLYVIPTLLIVSVISFVIIQLPPGDFLTSYVATLRAQGAQVTEAEIVGLRHRYGLDQPLYTRYFKWMWGLLHGDLGVSFRYNQPVSELIGSRLLLTVALALSALIIHWIIAFPIGIYSAVNQYSIGDYAFTTLAFVSAAIPQFMLTLLAMWVIFSTSGFTITGLFSPSFEMASWSWAKVLDLVKHASVAVGILGVTGGAGLIRTMRANLLDELHKPYVATARAKGLSERRVLLKYPVRVALSPFVSTVGWSLPGLISGTTVISIVMGLPTTGFLLYKGLLSQDMYLAGSFIMLLSFLTIAGTLISDILLALLDPRVRYEANQ